MDGYSPTVIPAEAGIQSLAPAISHVTSEIPPTFSLLVVLAAADMGD